MAKKKFHFSTRSKNPPTVELNTSGLYVRFQKGVDVAETVIRSQWPHVALDLAADGSVVGIECVPVPETFSLKGVARKAGVALPRSLSAGDVQISASERGQRELAVC